MGLNRGNEPLPRPPPRHKTVHHANDPCVLKTHVIVINSARLLQSHWEKRGLILDELI